jgi:hypothetical protein
MIKKNSRAATHLRRSFADRIPLSKGTGRGRPSDSPPTLHRIVSAIGKRDLRTFASYFLLCCKATSSSFVHLVITDIVVSGGAILYEQRISHISHDDEVSVRPVLFKGQIRAFA